LVTHTYTCVCINEVIDGLPQGIVNNIRDALANTDLIDWGQNYDTLVNPEHLLEVLKDVDMGWHLETVRLRLRVMQNNNWKISMGS
jgi:hypothetical protein